MRSTADYYPLYEPDYDGDTKDPCVVFDGETWHLFGTGRCDHERRWDVLHLVAPAPEGPWTLRDRTRLSGVITTPSTGACAPGVVFDAGRFHMFLQTDFERPGGVVHYLVSDDGSSWEHVNVALVSRARTCEAGVYDPHPSIVHGKKCLVYSGFPERDGPPRPDIYLAVSESDTWAGPWRRVNKILDHAQVQHHNQHWHDDYERGLEGAQMVETPDGRVVLVATCFLSEGTRGNRQRVFLATSDEMAHAFAAREPTKEIFEGENGHSSLLFHEGELLLFYQERRGRGRWRYGLMRGQLREDP